MPAGAATLAAFAANGLFAGLSGLFLATTFHHASHALAGATLFIVFTAGVLSQLATARLRASRVFALGTVSMLVGLVLLVTAVRLSTPSLALFLDQRRPDRRGRGRRLQRDDGPRARGSRAREPRGDDAELLIALFVGLSVPVIGAGVALDQGASAPNTVLGFAILVGLGVAGAGWATARPPAAAGAVTTGFPDSNSRVPATTDDSRKGVTLDEPGRQPNSLRASGLRARPTVGARPGAQRAGLLRRTRRAEPVLGHRRHVPVGVPDHVGRRRAARRAADDRPQHPARGRRDRVGERREQQGRRTSSTRTTTPTTSARPRCSTRT